MASALAVRQAGLAQLSDGFVRRPDIQALLPKVSLATNDTASEDDPAFAAFDRVKLRLADGREIQSPELKYARGHWTVPLRREEFWTKFRDCTAASLGTDEAAALFEKLQAIETVAQIRDLRRHAGLRAAS
jgi:2-methylcitrate dehydratase PrpD